MATTWTSAMRKAPLNTPIPLGDIPLTGRVAKPAYDKGVEWSFGTYSMVGTFAVFDEPPPARLPMAPPAYGRGLVGILAASHIRTAPDAEPLGWWKIDERRRRDVDARANWLLYLRAQTAIAADWAAYAMQLAREKNTAWRCSHGSHPRISVLWDLDAGRPIALIMPMDPVPTFPRRLHTSTVNPALSAAERMRLGV